MTIETRQATVGQLNPWVMWLNFCNVLHSWQEEWCHMWGHYCLPSLFSPHPHEGHHQLEIPDPLVESKEPELFA